MEKRCSAKPRARPAPQAGAGRVNLSKDTVVAGLLKEALDETPGSTQASRLKAWELLAKLCGYFEPEQGVGRTVHFDIRLDEPTLDSPGKDGSSYESS